MVLFAAVFSLILVTGYLIIYNIFQLSILRDIRFYGLLKPLELRKAAAETGLPAGVEAVRCGDSLRSDAGVFSGTAFASHAGKNQYIHRQRQLLFQHLDTGVGGVFSLLLCLSAAANQ